MHPERRFKLLAAVALSDGELNTDEEAFLYRLAERLGLARGMAHAIMASLLQAESDSGLQPALPPTGSLDLFQDLLDLVHADGAVGEIERRLILHLAPAFGVSRAEALELLDD